MELRSLGGTGIEVSRLALGCGTFGGVGSPPALIGRGLDEAAAFATMDEAVVLGIGVSPGALALAWVMGHPQVTAAVAGPARSGEHLQLLREALTVKLGELERQEVGAWFARQC